MKVKPPKIAQRVSNLFFEFYSVKNILFWLPMKTIYGFPSHFWTIYHSKNLLDCQKGSIFCKTYCDMILLVNYKL